MIDYAKFVEKVYLCDVDHEGWVQKPGHKLYIKGKVVSHTLAQRNKKLMLELESKLNKDIIYEADPKDLIAELYSGYYFKQGWMPKKNIVQSFAIHEGKLFFKLADTLKIKESKDSITSFKNVNPNKYQFEKSFLFTPHNPIDKEIRYASLFNTDYICKSDFKYLNHAYIKGQCLHSPYYCYDLATMRHTSVLVHNDSTVVCHPKVMAEAMKIIDKINFDKWCDNEL